MTDAGVRPSSGSPTPTTGFFARRALGSVFRNLGTFLRIAALPILGLVLMYTVLAIVFLPIVFSRFEVIQAGEPESSLALWAFLIGLAANLLYMATVVVFGVSWMRFVLLTDAGYKPSLVTGWDSAHTRCFLVLLAFALLFFLPTQLIVMSATPDIDVASWNEEAVRETHDGLSLGLFLIVCAVNLILGVLALRLGTLMPAAAVGELDYRLADAWRDTRKIWVPMLIATILVILVLFAIVILGMLLLVAPLAWAITSAVGNVAGMFVPGLFGLVVSMVHLAACFTLVSEGFRQGSGWSTTRILVREQA